MIMNNIKSKSKREPRPDWLKTTLRRGAEFVEVNRVIRFGRLHTVCEEARCPNMGECWGHGTATIMILGDVCTRNCRFCAVGPGHPNPLDLNEPDRVVQAIKDMNLQYAVITSVTRDDLDDGGADTFARIVEKIRQDIPGCYIELLIPDFNGSLSALNRVIEARPDVLGHNLETAPRLYPKVRPQADYTRSLNLLASAKKGGLIVKSGIMVGIGEQPQEVFPIMEDLRELGCDIMTIGQYLQPSRHHFPVDRYVRPDEFEMYRVKGYKMGFRQMESAPLVRSSYHAERAKKLIESSKS